MSASTGEATGAWLEPSTYEDYEVTAPMQARFSGAIVKMTSKLVSRCTVPGGMPAVEACIRERMIAAFDTQHITAGHCPPEFDLEKQYNCIVMGAYAHHFVQMVAGESEPEIDWTDPQRTMEGAVTEVLEGELRGCISGFSASDMTDCIFRQLSKKLGLAESEFEPCRVLTDDFLFGKCIGEAHAAAFIESGISRM